MTVEHLIKELSKLNPQLKIYALIHNYEVELGENYFGCGEMVELRHYKEDGDEVIQLIIDAT